MKRFHNDKTIYFQEGDSTYLVCTLGDLWYQSLNKEAAVALEIFHLTTISEVTKKIQLLGHPNFQVTTDGTDFSSIEMRLQGPREIYPDPQSIALAGTSKMFHQAGLHYLMLQNFATSKPSRIAKVSSRSKVNKK